MRVKRHTTPDTAPTDLHWRIAPAGEVLDEEGGMIDGTVRARMQSLLGHNRFWVRGVPETNDGAEFVERIERTSGKGE